MQQKKPIFKSRQHIGKWELLSPLGSGGNGEVWRVRNTENPEVPAALKILTRFPQSNEPLERFKNEVRILGDLAGVAGILPLVEASTPEDAALGNTWLAMPVAVPIKQALTNDPSLKQTVSALRDIAKTLALLAERAINHRDLKPRNLYRLGDEWVIGDFGLVKFPSGPKLTVAGRAVGSLDYLAPELRANEPNIDYEKTDVYALGKIFWELATNHNRPLYGEQRADTPAVTISAYFPDEPDAQLLDKLLERMTLHSPENRPKMAAVYDELNAWLSTAPIPENDEDLSDVAFSLQIHRRREEALREAQERSKPPWQKQGHRQSLQERVVVALSPILEFLWRYPEFSPAQTDGSPIPDWITPWWFTEGQDAYVERVAYRVTAACYLREERFGGLPATLHIYITAHVFKNEEVVFEGNKVLDDPRRDGAGNASGGLKYLLQAVSKPAPYGTALEGQELNVVIRELMDALPSSLREFVKAIPL